MKFRENATDPLLVTAGLAAVTKRILLVSTVHILYGWHPLHLAKFGATISEMSGGRWGLNMVTGYKKSEFEMFGLEQIEHDQRYVMADEFVTMMKRLWCEDDNLTVDGRFWKMKNAFVAPKPAGGKCVLVNASSSGGTPVLPLSLRTRARCATWSGRYASARPTCVAMAEKPPATARRN